MSNELYWVADPRDVEDRIPDYQNPPKRWLQQARHAASAIAKELADSRGRELIRATRWHHVPEGHLEAACCFWCEVWDRMPLFSALRWRVELKEYAEFKLLEDTDDSPPSLVDVKLFYGTPDGVEVMMRRILLDLQLAYSIVETPAGELTVIQLALRHEAKRYEIPAEVFKGLSFQVIPEK